jgi:serine/threonine protein kinase
MDRWSEEEGVDKSAAAAPTSDGDEGGPAVLEGIDATTLNVDPDHVLGEGVFSKVLLGHDALGRRFAAKTFTRGAYPTQLAMATREFDLVGPLRHPNIIRALALLTDEPVASVILELAVEGDLAGVLVPYSKQGLPARNGIPILQGVCCGLQHLHDIAKLVHGDVKPSNILLDAEGTPKLCDFGATLPINGVGGLHKRPVVIDVVC